MKLLPNVGNERVVDSLRAGVSKDATFDMATPQFSLFAFAEMRDWLARLKSCRVVLPDEVDLGLLGGDDDRSRRNSLNAASIASACHTWLEKNASVRTAPTSLSQCVLSVSTSGQNGIALAGDCPFSTSGLGITSGNQFSLIQASENDAEAMMLAKWFEGIWNGSSAGEGGKQKFLESLEQLFTPKAPSLAYYLTLFHVFKDLGQELDEEKIVRSATGIRQTSVWKKLYKFQRDGAVGAIDKLERFGGCILADSVGLGKTFEALAVIKYFELRNDRVLVLVPKRLRDNWTLYKANDKRNILSSDRFNYDVLNHTDLSRDRGLSGDIDLAHVNWGNYDLVVIDESHNFRNKKTPRAGGETRYDRLMRRIIREGVKTRVLMLSATPVNNRMTDLRNQIAFATEGQDEALADHGIESIQATTRNAQKQFNRWLQLEDGERKPLALMEMLGFDYFSLLDLLTIARSRKHIEKYYGTSETGRFPERLKPINIKSDVDVSGQLSSIRDINSEIRRLNLAAYAPLRYVLLSKQEAYDEKYSTQIRGGESFFRQVDREESLVHLLRVNVLKRMESSVASFSLTLGRQLADVERTLARIERHAAEQDNDSFEELDIADIDLDDPAVESLLVGRKIKVLLQDVDLIRWKQDLVEDRNRLATMHSIAQEIDATRDAKLQDLKQVIATKVRQPINGDNCKILIFTAFADTANYLFNSISGWARETLGIESALVTGSGRNQTTVPGMHRDLASVLTAFAPLAKERPEELAGEGEIELLFATDCISEGQNLQDCDFLINYDIHWNPVRIIQRFGRIDRIGSPNQCIQLVNFWPNMELEEYINLEQRVSGRMVLLDISATGEENLIEQQSGNQMNDLEYRRKQLLKLQDAVIDMEDLSSGLSIADLTLSDFRIDLAEFARDHRELLEQLPWGTFAVTYNTEEAASIPPGTIFCLRAVGESATKAIEPGYPLAPHYLVHVGEDGSTVLPFTQARQVLDSMRRLTIGRDLPDSSAIRRFDALTRRGADMSSVQAQLSSAVTSIVGKSAQRAVESLFTPGGTHAGKGDFAGIEDFEVVAFLVVLSESPNSLSPGGGECRGEGPNE
ncbi:helicase-related protein [Rosistilla oblonga]|uniref:helicase-related protein n=1 Tax=Rosistilla oblonga TaxID=2527990 RepID=UPI003A975146